MSARGAISRKKPVQHQQHSQRFSLLAQGLCVCGLLGILLLFWRAVRGDTDQIASPGAA